MNRATRTLTFVGFASFALGGAVFAETSEKVPSSMTLVEDVIIPVPSEIFSVLDKLGGANWKAELSVTQAQSTTDRKQLALLFGAVVAEGFVAVQAESQDSIRDLGKQILDIATALGLRDDVQKHAQSILEAADKRDWRTIRQEFDKTQKTVREKMLTLRDDELAQCVSIGGWIRGTATASGIISRNYSEERADLLSQPFLVEHFTHTIAKMPAKLREYSTINAISQGLATIAQQIPTDGTLVSAQGSKTIHAVCAELTARIRTPEN